MQMRTELEHRLLRNPFDVELRSEYAELLMANGEAEAALAQYLLLCQQDASRPEAQTGAARALLSLNRPTEALAHYAKARPLEGFQPDPELDRLESQAKRTTGPSLRVVTGADAKVTSIRHVPEERVRFSSIVGMEDLKRTIRIKIIEPFLNPGLFQKFRKAAGGGIMLYGPPGCGKTMIARAVANECNAEFITVGISDVLNMWIGESERNMAAIFEKARSKAPCVLFFDELDALAYSRSKASSEHTRTVVNELLTQLDGIGRGNNGVLILAATNMPWDVDPAIKRPGRFARQVFVPPPDQDARRGMLEIKLTGVPITDLDVEAIARRTDLFSGADIDGLIELAKEGALEESILSGQERPVTQDDFLRALQTVQPSTKDWLKTARNLVKYAGDDGSYRDVEVYLKRAKML
jgi:SpoVK/Ycf46/Vps4 family AAA+-type ATPase